MIFQIIESSSSGNCSFLECDGVKILIDAGIAITKIRSFLASKNLQLDDIDAVFITHEHSDHYNSLCRFKNCNAKIFANRATAECIRYKDSCTKNLNWHLFETGTEFDFYGIKVRSFSIPHDTSDPVGFYFEHNDKRLVYATDMGKTTYSVRDIVSQADVLVLESNYCPKMLERSNRPYYLKARIRGSYGHLSNADTIDLLKNSVSTNIQKIFLAHISRECNDLDHIADLLNNSGLDSSVLSKIEIVSPFYKSSSCFEF